MPIWRLRLLCYAEMAAEVEERIIVVAVAGQALPRSCHALLAVYVCCIAGRRSIRGIIARSDSGSDGHSDRKHGPDVVPWV